MNSTNIDINDYLFDDLRKLYIDPRIYSRGLPKVPHNLKKEYERNRNKIKKLIQKLYDICNYKAFNKESLNNQIDKLKELYLSWIMISFDGQYTGRSYIGNKNKLLRIFREISKYWTDENIHNYFCKIIESLDFKSGNPNRTKLPSNYLNKAFIDIFPYKIPDNIINVLLQYVAPQLRENIENNLKGPEYRQVFLDIMNNLRLVLNNNQIRELYCLLLDNIKFEPYSQLKMYFLIAFDKMNNHHYIKKDIIENIFFETVKNNRGQICRFLEFEFKLWL